MAQLRILTREGHTNCSKVTQSQMIETEFEYDSVQSSSTGVPAGTAQTLHTQARGILSRLIGFLILTALLRHNLHTKHSLN